MPDSSLPPSWGPAPFDERDLDAVLSGETADISPALRSVADTLAVLRGAAPTPAELRGEAAVMAEYRALGLGQPDGPAQTLVLPAVPAGRSPRRAARHRARRRRVPSVGRRAGALMGVAAAVLIGVVAASGNLSGPIEHITHLGRTSSPSATHGGNLTGTGATATKSASTPDPTPTHGQALTSPTPSSSVSPNRLCQEFFYGYFTHHEPPASRAARTSLYQELTRLADSRDPSRFCSQYLGSMLHDGDHGTRPKNQRDQGQGNAPGNAARPDPSPAASSTPTEQGATGPGNGNGGSGPGQGNAGGGPGSNP